MKQTDRPLLFRMFENLTNLFYLMVGVPLMGFIWVYLNLKLLHPWGYFADPDLKGFLHATLLLLALVPAWFAFIQYRKRFTGLEPGTDSTEGDDSLREKVERFSAASRQKYGLLTISSLLVVLGFYLSAEEFYVGIYSILMIIFSVNRPTPQRMAKDMRLKKEEREALFKKLREEKEEHL